MSQRVDVDAKILHIAITYMIGTVAWDKHGDHEYVLIGDGVTIDAGRLQQLIDATFSDSLLYISFNRHRGFSTPRHEAAAEIAKHIGQNIAVADSNLHVFLQLNRIGVARTGISQANKQSQTRFAAQLRRFESKN